MLALTDSMTVLTAAHPRSSVLLAASPSGIHAASLSGMHAAPHSGMHAAPRSAHASMSCPGHVQPLQPQSGTTRCMLPLLCRFSAHSREALQELVQEQYTGTAVLEAPAALLLNADSIATWWSLQKLVLLADKVGQSVPGAAAAADAPVPSLVFILLRVQRVTQQQQWQRQAARAALQQPFP